MFVKRVMLIALGVLVMSGVLARWAGADSNCKPNRATCRTNGQCCSGVCAAGLCAAPATTTSTAAVSTTTTSTSTTTTSTAATVCGTGTVLVGNECQPNYTAICGTGTQLVNGQCVPEGTCPPPSCGDGIVDFDAGEACDDGNVVTETQCPYGTATCTGCNADCSAEISLTGPYCSDGTTTCPEVCDDGNTDACGTCSATCSAQQPAAHATGLIVAVDGASLADGETFTLDDGIGTVVTFEFDVASDGVEDGNTAINVSGAEPASSMATKIQAAINDHPDLQIDAEAISNVVSLTNQRASSLGNEPIVRNVSDPDFFVTGMGGGAGGDCGEGVGCATDSDCTPGLVCVNNTCNPEP